MFVCGVVRGDTWCSSVASHGIRCDQLLRLREWSCCLGLPGISAVFDLGVDESKQSSRAQCRNAADALRTRLWPKHGRFRKLQGCLGCLRRNHLELHHKLQNTRPNQTLHRRIKRYQLTRNPHTTAPILCILRSSQTQPLNRQDGSRSCDDGGGQQ